MDFGYSINQSSKIDMDRASGDIAAQVLRYEPSFAVCIGCGACMATCSAGRFTPFNLRRLQLMVMRGQTDSVHAEAEKCMLCGKCRLICPRGINTRNVLLAIHHFTAPAPTLDIR
ncbi:MAG: 4Fe-4S dicluster domain-containing protein [Bacteroidales bacterium]|jgi:heterodisulfide reductase subunit C|nr:4Fe-4S dicluster domain-containing protein [Bacteroidales bacterium]